MLTFVANYADSNTRKWKPEIFKFPGGESQIVLPASFLIQQGSETVVNYTINAFLKTADDVMQLLLLTDAIRRTWPGIPVNLNMPYVPYARQDRVCNPGESMSIKVFCKLINDQNYNKVSIADPHSDVTSALLSNVHVVDAVVMVGAVLTQPVFNNGVVLIAPDAGARKRVLGMAKELKVENIGYADKIRNTKTGMITGTSVSDFNKELPLLVVDDICDGGRTFIELGKVLKANTEQRLYLYVTHGIFSKGLEELNNYYDRIYTAYNWNDDMNINNLSIVKTGSLL